MLTEFRLDDDNRITARPADLDGYGEGVVWLDASNPVPEELAALERLMGFELPDNRDMSEIELSARLYKEDGALVMIANLLPKSETRTAPPRPSTFILRENLLLTIRYDEFYSFARVEADLPRRAEPHTPLSVFFRLMEEAVSDRADNLEHAMHTLEELTSQLFALPPASKSAMPDNPELEQILRGIGMAGERVSNIRESITGLQRVLNFARAYIPDSWPGHAAGVMNSLRNDLTALSDEADFLVNKLSFNLDATLGMINMEETKVVRFLSVVTLLLSPPTLIAGIYGMNFAAMPELAWPFGYVFALGLMAASAVTSIWYLRRRKWF